MERPPLWRRLGYYYFWMRLPVRYREWVEADIASPTFLIRRVLTPPIVMGLLMGIPALVAVIVGIPVDTVTGNAAVTMILGLFAACLLDASPRVRRWARAQALRHHSRFWQYETEEFRGRTSVHS